MALPRDETAFFGRESEILEIERRFAAGARLVTIVGLGGMGKTRLAVAAANASSMTRSALFVALGEARTLEAAVREVAAATGVTLKADAQARAALESLAGALGKKGPLLLVLDNTEQLGPAARELAS
ncbi:MAG: hypothetical protein J0I07_10950, partial [Myxococcales bacterium]|nr:hypothetical protein [Myxococcales bacterium]